MPAIDTGGARIVRKPKKRPAVRVNPPDQADRKRSPGQKARDRRTVNRTIAHAEARARVTPDQADRKRSPVQQAKDRAAVAQNVASSRQAYLGKRGRGGGVRQLKKELEGSGVVAGGVSGLANMLTASVDPSVSWNKRAKQEGLGDIKPSLPGKALRDFANAPAQFIPSVYIPVAGAVEAIHHPRHPDRLAKFYSDANKSDPVLNAVAAAYDVATGDKKSAGKRWEHTKQAASEHPGFTFLEVAGAKGVLGRGAGAAVRGGARATGSETLKQLGTTKRAPKTLPDTNIVEHRKYSKDLITKRFQVYNDKIGAKRAAALREEAKHEANPRRKAELRKEAHKADPTRIDDKDIQRRVDYHVAAVDDVRRINQAKILKRENKTLKQAKEGGPLVSLLTQRIVRPTIESLKNYRSDLITVGKTMEHGSSKLRANQQLVHDLDQAIEKLKSGKLNIDQLKEIADRFAGHSVESQAGLTGSGIYNREQSERRAVSPFAVREMGAHRDPGYLTAAEKAARKTAKKTGKTAAKARGRVAGRVAADKRVTAADVLQQEARPLREPSALQALKATHEAAAKARGKQIKSATTRARNTTTKAEAAAGVHTAAKALRKANPLLIEEKVTTRVPVTGSKRKRTVTTTQKRKVETPEIVAALEAIHGKGARAGLVSQNPEFESGGSDFLQMADKPKPGEKRLYGGGATVEGTLDASPERMLRQHVRAQALQDAHTAWTSFISQFARRTHGNQKIERYTDSGKATKAANDLNAKGETQWRVVRLSPFKSGDEQLRSLLEGAGEDPQLIESETATNALKGEGDGPWAIVPEAAAKQMQQHMNGLNQNNAARGLRSLSSGFRRAVLATSVPWMVGNTEEAAFRSAINRVGPGSLIRGHRISSAIDRLADTPEAAQHAKARLLGGGHYAFADRRIHANLDAYTDGFVKDVTGGWRKVSTESPARAIPWLWDRWTHFAFNTTNKNIEQFFQKGMLGRAAKDLLTDDLRAHSQKAIDEMAHGVIDPNTAAALKTEIDKMYGKYQGMSPSERWLINNYTPFGAWTYNAASLLAHMPGRHPATTLAGTAAVNATEDWRKSQGLDIGSEGEMARWLQGSIPLAHGAHLRQTRFTPMSLGTDFFGTAAGTVLPQFSSLLKAAEGQDWTGQPLKRSDGKAIQDTDKFKAGLTAFLNSTIPGLTLGQTIAKKGPLAIPQSAVGYTPSRASGNKGKGGFRPPKSGSGADRFGGQSRFGKGRFDGGSRFSGQSRFK